MSLLFVATGKSAASNTPASAPHDLVEVLWVVDINDDKHVPADAYTDGVRVFLPVSLWKELGITQRLPQVTRIHHHDYFLPQDILGALVEVDFNQLTVRLKLPGKSMTAQLIDMSSADVRPLTPEPPWSAFLDYNYSDTHSGQANYQQMLIAPHLRIAGWSIFDEQLFQQNPNGFSNVRLQTTAFRDWPGQALRLSVGDSAINTGELGISLPFAGIDLQRNYALQPGFITNPTASLTGITESPSVANIYLNGVLIGTTRLAPGPFNLQNLQNYGGLSNIAVVVQDASGGEQRYSVPYYFTDQLLQAGLDTFDIGVGSPRASFGAGNYSGAAGAGSYLYGVTDNWTVGLRGSSVRDDDRISPLMTVGLGTLGVATLLDSVRWHEGQKTQAAEFNFSRQWSGTTIRLQWRYAQLGFDDPPPAGIGTTLPDLRARDSVALGWDQNIGAFGNFSATLTRQTRFNGSTLNGQTLSWSIKLPARGLLQLSALNLRSPGTVVRGFFATVSYSFGQQGYINSGYRQTTGSDPLIYTQVSEHVPPGGGFGYEAYASHQGDQDDRDVNAEWQGSWLEMELGARETTTGSATYDAQRIRISGSFATVGGNVYAAPYIDNAFAVVSTGYPDVRVYRSNNLIGTTGPDGTLLIPQLAPYVGTTLSVDEDDLPLDVDLVTPKLEAVPADGAGLRMNFVLPKIAAAIGRLRQSQQIGGALIDNHLIDVTGPDGHTYQSRTGDAGFFELDGVVSGTYRLDVHSPDHSCIARLVVPPNATAVWSLGEIVCE